MKPIYYAVSSLLLAILFLLTEGCSQKNLNEDAPSTIAGNVRVIFDWSKVSGSQAASMGLYLYSDEHDMVDYWFNSPDGDIIRAYSGRHTAVCHSNDDPYVHILRNQHSHDEIEVFTDNIGVLLGQGISTHNLPRAPGTEDQPLRMTPSMIYGAQNRDINLRATNLAQTITLYPEELVCHYSVEFVDVENLQNSDLLIDATISSLAGGYYPGKMVANSEAVSHSFTLTPDEQLHSLRAEFLTFGLPVGEELPHKLCLYIALKNNTGSLYTFDVSDQVNKAPDPRNVNITIYGLKLPDIPDDPPPPPSEGGMSVEITTWDTYHFDLQV